MRIITYAALWCALATFSAGCGDSTGPGATLVGSYTYSASALGVEDLFTGSVTINSVSDDRVFGAWNVAGYKNLFQDDGGLGLVNSDGTFTLIASGSNVSFVATHQVRLTSGRADCFEYRFVESLDDVDIGTCSMRRR